jgi:hypothetical protein
MCGAEGGEVVVEEIEVAHAAEAEGGVEASKRP